MRALLVAVYFSLHVSAASAQSVAISGYEFMEPSTRELQDDDFLNPGIFLLDEGTALWGRPLGFGSETCQSCHTDIAADMAGVASRYPTYDADLGRVVSLEMKINAEIVGRLRGKPLEYESEDLLALTALIGYQSRGMPMEIDSSPEAVSLAEEGKEIFQTRRGQLNLSCQNCHEEHWGEKLRGDTISQGQINAFPIYRLTWTDVGSRQRMFVWCMESIRSEPYDYGSDEFLALEAFLAIRGQGLLIETPGVRR
jgi:sulfur-oxidizing protein SoxA